jgi:hypothetical protein
MEMEMETKMETVGGEREGIIDDAVDVDEPDDDGVAVVGFDADRAKVVDGLEL